MSASAVGFDPNPPNVNADLGADGKVSLFVSEVLGTKGFVLGVSTLAAEAGEKENPENGFG